MKAYRSTLNKAGDRFITITMTEEEAKLMRTVAWYSDIEPSADVANEFVSVVSDVLATDPEPSIVRSQSVGKETT